MKLSDLAQALNQSQNAALVVGAGISYDMGIPLGYQIPMLYGEKHPHLLKKYGLDIAWQQVANAASADRWKHEYHFVVALLTALIGSIELQQTFVDWLSEMKNMMGSPSDTHAAFIIAWFNRVFRHLVTTNWDFLLEYQVDAIYHPPEISEGIYPDVFDPVTHIFTDGRSTIIDPERLYFLNSIDEENYFWESRWDIVTQRSDLKNIQNWTRSLWKIHGSPFFLACPKCGGFSRWHHTEKRTVGDPCPQHPDETLQPEIIFWGQGIDTADALVWKRLRGRLQRSDMIVACGFSGSGSDAYLREVVENHQNAWLVNPDTGDWDTDRVRHISAGASEFATMLIDEFLT
ncbi:MAG: hypothetical protein H6672_11330 [Anaerolineaceae bacterium]|nr:hypothetical protein [Anaerolineaceae bacterium]